MGGRLPKLLANTMERVRMRYQKAFTLIEVMIVVAIVAILSMIAVPSYTDYIRRGRITEAVGNLSDMRVKLEQYFQDNRTYVGACVAGTVAPLPAAGGSSTFTFACPALTATTYLVRATGAGPMTGFVYTIDQSNNRRTTGLPAGWAGAAATSTCWVLKKDGTC
jgi:type IV pilus assembly protein PilE